MAKIRITRIEDIEDARELFTQAFKGQLWIGDDHEYWVAWEGDKIVGFASAVHRPSNNTVFLSSCAVVSSHRGSGLQRRLVRSRVSWGKRIPGTLAVVTYVELRNYASLQNLFACGFRGWRLPVNPEWHLLYRRLDGKTALEDWLKSALRAM